MKRNLIKILSIVVAITTFSCSKDAYNIEDPKADISIYYEDIQNSTKVYLSEPYQVNVNQDITIEFLGTGEYVSVWNGMEGGAYQGAIDTAKVNFGKDISASRSYQLRYIDSGEYIITIIASSPYDFGAEIERDILQKKIMVNSIK